MNEIKVKWSSKKPSDSIREYQSGLEMCFITGNNSDNVAEQVMDFVICKDYLHTTIAGCLLDKKQTHLYFSYDPKTEPDVYLERTRIAIGNREDKGLANKIPALLDFLNQFEKRIHLMCSVAFTCNPPERFKDTGCFMLEGSGRWMLSPPMISLYSLLIRVGLRHNLGDNFDETIDRVILNKEESLPRGTVGCNDHEYLRAAMPGIERIQRIGYASIFHRNIKDNYPDVSTSYMHHKTGIVGYSTKLCEMHFPHWFRFDKRNKQVAKKKTDEK